MTRWLQTAPAARPRARVLCLPRAGGTARDVWPWAATFGDEVQLAAVQLPGRLDRFRERALDSVAAIVAAVAPIARALDDLPLVVFGDCMGTLVAYELACELRRAGVRAPAALVVASYPPPDHPRDAPPYHAAPPDQLRARLAQIGGVPPEVLADDEMFGLMLPTLRADFAVFETYRHGAEPPLDVDVHAILGDGDPHVVAADLDGWARHTTRRFERRGFAGDHFFLRDNADVPRYVRDLALAAAA